MSVSVSLSALTGESFQLDVDRSTTVSSLAKIIHCSWHVPQVCLKLVHGTKVLNDGSIVADCLHDLENGEPLCLTVIISLDDIYRALCCASVAAHKAALRSLVSLVLQGEPEVMTLFKMPWEETFYVFDIQSVAVDILIALSGSLDDTDVDSSSGYETSDEGEKIEDGDSEQDDQEDVEASDRRKRAMVALVRFLEKNSSVTAGDNVNVDNSDLTTMSGRLRCAGIDMLTCVALGISSPQSATRNQFASDDRPAIVSTLICRVIAALVSVQTLRDGTPIARAIAACLKDPCRSVRTAVLDALPHFSGKTDDSIIDLICKCLDDQRHDHGLDVAVALEAVAGRGNACAIGMVCRRLKHPELAIRRNAASVLIKIVETDVEDATLLAEISSCLAHEDPAVRITALELTPRLAVDDKLAAFKKALACIEDASPLVRQAAAQAATRMVAHGDSDALNLVSTYLEHQNLAVRCAAVDILTSIATDSGEAVIVVVIPYVKHPDGGVRCLALEVLSEIGCNSGSFAVLAVRALASHQDADIRRSAALGLAKLSNGDDSETVETLRRLCGDADAAVQIAARDGLVEIGCGN